MTDYIPQLLLAWSIQLVGVVSPGPSVLLILGVATSRGRLPSLVTAFGVASGSIILSTATVLGIAALFAEMADAMTIVRMIGAGYLFWLAFRAFRSAATPGELAIRPVAVASLRRTWLAGFALQVSNPKAILFWLAVASVGGVGDAPLPVVVFFVAGAFVNSFAGHGGYALLLSSAPVRRLYFRFRNQVEAALGSLFLFAGLKLAISRS